MLQLLPNILDENNWAQLPCALAKIIDSLDMLLAESRKAACRYLRHFSKTVPIEIFNKHSCEKDIAFFVEQMQANKTLGLISDAGLPAIADPGSRLVLACHQNKIPVDALSGPSSITLGLMLAGFCANRFSFYGYLPKNRDEKRKKALLLERRSEKENSAEIFIETPYRAQHLFSFLLSSLQDTTYLFVGKELATPEQEAFSQTIADWKKHPISLEKQRTIFILYRGHFFSSQTYAKFGKTGFKNKGRL